MAVTQKQLKEHFLKLGSGGAIYVWGANCETITQALVDSLYKKYGSSKYNKTYYNNKLKEGKGKIGADCSGSLRPVSGYDTTAAKYYSRSVEKGKIGTLPRNKVCLVFKQDSKGTINHVGCYTGDGYVSEMASSKLNYQRKKVDGNGWDLWGMPDFVSDPNNNNTPAKPTNKIEEDGVWGVGTTKRAQEVFGTTVDGKISNQYKKYEDDNPGLSSSTFEWESKPNGSSKLIKAIQKKLGIEQDGHIGPDTIKAMQKWLGTKVDGHVSRPSQMVKAFQKWLNKQ